MQANALKQVSLAREILSYKKLPFFIFLVAASSGFTLYINAYYNTETLWVNTYGEQLTLERIEQMMEAGRRYRFIVYLIIPIIIFIRICYNTVFVAMGGFFSNQDVRVSQIYNACLKAEIAFVLLTITRLVFIQCFMDINNLQDLNILPLSAFQLLHLYNLPKWALQPLSYINVFEFLYMILLTFFLTQYNGRQFWRNFRLVLATYGAGLLLWFILLVYISILFS